MGKKTQDVVVHDDGIFARGTFGNRSEGSQLVTGDPLEFSLDPYGGSGATFRGKPIADLERVVEQIDLGGTIPTDNGKGIITYSFYTEGKMIGVYNNPQYGFGALDGLAPFSATQMDAARGGIQLWDDLIPQTFVEVSRLNADIVIANSADPAQAYAFGARGDASGPKYVSDVFVADPKLNWTNEWFSQGGYGTTTLIHEFGHSLGLSHPGAYNGAAATNYLGQAEYAQDSTQYTIMSYWNAGETGARIINWDLLFYHNPQTPLLHDILTIQTKYGADPTTRVDDTTYGFNSTAGREVYDFSVNGLPYLAIYDAGGEDTIDLSGFTASQFLDLHAGSFSSIGEAIPTATEINGHAVDLYYETGYFPGYVSQATVTSIGNSFMNANARDIALDTGETGVFATNYSNVAIAYGTTIENGVGGQARDVLWGNEVDNMLDGQAGNDVLNGFEGDDILIGGLGNDKLTGGEGGDTFEFSTLELGDLITDFDGGEGDMIDLSGLADDVVGGNALAFVDGFTNVAGQVTYDAGTGHLMMDADGNGAADFMVTLQAGAELDASMLMLAAG